MATAKKAAKTPSAKKAAPTPVAEKAVKTPAAAKRAPAGKTAATKAAGTKAAATKVAATKTAATKTAAARTAASGIKPVKEAFTKAGLAAHLAEQTSLDPKAVKSVLAALETTILGAVHKKGVREFTLPGLLKIGVQAVPAKKKRFGKDPFTGEERWFDAKPASVKIKARALKKLKDAAI
jgi:nucleoid DNA-binding protein